FVRPRVSPCTSSLRLPLSSVPFFSFPDTPTTETYTLSLHDALPIWDMLNNDPTEEDAERARAMLRDLGEHPLHELTTPVLAEMFSQVGDPLPEDVDDWPAWLVTDPSLMRQILDHWRTVPKASGKAKEEAACG